MNSPALHRSYALAALLLATGCAAPHNDTNESPKGISGAQNALSGLEWTEGTLQSGILVPVTQLRDLPGVNDATVAAGEVGGLVGAPFWKSNNPEAVTGEGWLMTNGGNAPQRGGQATPVTGPISVYLSHLNYTGEKNNRGETTTNRKVYIHLIASNPSPQAITITGKGLLVANNKWRFRPSTPLTAKSAWYLCSEAWTNNTLTNVSQTVQPFKVVEIGKVLLPAQTIGQDRYATEGRYELNVAGGGAYLSAVATFDGDLDRAAAFCTGSNAKQADGTAGNPLITPNPDSGTNYGREAGIATNSAYYTGDVNLTLPASGAAYMALCYNTNRRKPAILGNTALYYQEQSARHTMRLLSSSQTWAGYGHKYNAKLVLTNPTATQKNVRISLGANPINAPVEGNSNSLVFDGPVQTLVNGASGEVHQVILYNNQYATNPRGPQRQALRTVQVPGNGTVTVNVICFIPGLVFGAGQQLVIESGV